MASKLEDCILAFLFSIIFIDFVLSEQVVIEYSEDRKPCAYFVDTRVATPEHGLINCSWYDSQSCCKRTEVTSVFGSNILPLNGASKVCQNHLNYMMCYFCSPDQYRWYRDGKVHICEEFCDATHNECRDAVYHNTRLGEKYKNGTSFCEAQNFEVVSSKYCFKYDPTVFGRAVVMETRMLITVTLLLFPIMVWLERL